MILQLDNVLSLEEAAALRSRLLADDMRLLWHPYTSATRPLPCC